MPPALAAVPGQAHQACLAFIKAPGVEDDGGVEAAQFLWQLVGGNRRLAGYVERRERMVAGGKQWGAAAPAKLHLTLTEPGSDDYRQSVQGQLLAAGLAQLVEPKGPQVGAAGAGLAEGRCWDGGGLRRYCGCRRCGAGTAAGITHLPLAPGPSCTPPLPPSPPRQRRCCPRCARARRRRGASTWASSATETPIPRTTPTTAASPASAASPPAGAAPAAERLHRRD